MRESFTTRIKNAWNAFLNRDPPAGVFTDYGYVSMTRPDRARFTGGNEQSIINSIYTRIAVDCASTRIVHANMDDAGNFVGIRKSSLNYCLNDSANLDQTGRALIEDAVISLLDEGVIAIVPVDTEGDPRGDTFKIESLRVGKILQWYPSHVQVRLYNEQNGQNEDITLPKYMVAIIENPFYEVMNEFNSTLQRLKHKLNLLDVIDEQNSSGKLDLIIQLPYTVKTPARKQYAEDRRKDIESQLTGSKYGIAYTDGTEKIVQLNRPVENNMLSQIEYLTSMLYSQLSMTKEVLDGSASEQTMINYFNRTIEPILNAITEEMNRKFLTKTARSQGQAVYFYRDPFKLLPLSQVSTVADTLTRNAIMTSNEMRQKIGLLPIDDPVANELRNKNLSVSNAEQEALNEQQVGENQNGSSNMRLIPQINEEGKISYEERL